MSRKNGFPGAERTGSFFPVLPAPNGNRIKIINNARHFRDNQILKWLIYEIKRTTERFLGK